MKKKNRKFATTLLATALLSSTPGHLLFPLRGNSPCGFTLKTTAQPQPVEQASAEMCVTAEETTTQDLVATPKRKADSKTGQPSPEYAPMSHGKPLQKQRHQVTAEPNTAEPEPPSEDILQKILTNTYEFNGDEVIYTETAINYITFPTAEELKPVCVNGFGWVEPNNEPSIRIQALDLYESGVKVGTMGG